MTEERQLSITDYYNDPSLLAKLMLIWEDKRREADRFEEMIKEVVFLREDSLTVGNVTAKYYSGRTTYDYEGAARANASQEQIEAHTHIVTEHKTNWRLICEDAKIEAPVKSKSEPSVSLSLS